MQYSYVVFCDLDETIINCKSLIEVYKAYCIELNNLDIFEKIYKQLLIMKKIYSRNYINKWFYSNFKNIDQQVMQDVINKWLYESLKNPKFFNPKVIKKLKQHNQENAFIIVVSGSFYDCVNAICRYIPVNTLLCTTLKEINGTYNGEILGNPIIGNGKVRAIKKYMHNNNLNFKNSFAYGDHISDLPMLYLADNPIIISKNNKDLLATAKKNGWGIIL